MLGASNLETGLAAVGSYLDVYQRPKRRVIRERLLEGASLVLTRDGLCNTSRNERFLNYA